MGLVLERAVYVNCANVRNSFIIVVYFVYNLL